MTLPAPRLDDLTWADMMAAIRRRIPAESDGAWTLHAPADPGITLLELFAYLLEQRLYWLDQVPDELVVAVLRLLGLEPPRPAVAAATVLRLVSSGAETSSGRPEGHGLLAGPVRAHHVHPRRRASRSSRPTARSPCGRTATAPPTCVPAGGSPAGERRFGRVGPVHPAAHRRPSGVWLAVAAGRAGRAGARRPGRRARCARCRRPAELTWAWFRPDTTVSGSFVDVVDGTAGLRRSGVIRLVLPEDWTTENRGLVVSTRAATFAAPPRLLQLAVNVSAAQHSERRTVTGTELADQIDRWLKLPGQRLVLPDAAGRLLDAMLTLAGDKWNPVVDFAFGASSDLIFVLDRTEGALVFGDGLTGRIPLPTKDVLVELRHRRRPGRQRRHDRELAARGGFAGRGRQPGPGGGRHRPGDRGSRPGNVRPGALGEVTRAVTAEDYVTLATTTPGVAVGRAYASRRRAPGLPVRTRAWRGDRPHCPVGAS